MSSEQTGPSTLFADDLLIHYEFNSKPELDKFLPNLAKCLAILKSIGLRQAVQIFAEEARA